MEYALLINNLTLYNQGLTNIETALENDLDIPLFIYEDEELKDYHDVIEERIDKLKELINDQTNRLFQRASREQEKQKNYVL